MLFVSCSRKFYLSQDNEDIFFFLFFLFLFFFSWEFYCFSYLDLQSSWNWFLFRVWLESQVSVFISLIPDWPSTLLKRPCFLWLYCTVTFVIKEVTCVRVYFWARSFILFIHLSSLVSVLHCLNNYSFISLDIQHTSLYFKVALDSFGFWHVNFRISYNFYGKNLLIFWLGLHWIYRSIWERPKVLSFFI